MQNFIVTARDAGFSISIAFLFLDSADVCVARVAERVRKGGHHVPEADIRRRFTRSVCNFWRIYRELADTWVFLYNGMMASREVSAGSQKQLVVRHPALYSMFLDLAGESP